jgi:GNAT superfamily N-acetyltransferase
VPSMIRAATQSDFDVLVQLSIQTIRARYTAFLGQDSVDGFVGSGEVDQYVRNNLHRCWVIVVDEATVGYCVLKENRLDLMMIDHRYHRRGFGSQLLLYAEQALFREHDEIVLESFEPNHVANAFYRHHGWVEVRRRSDAKAGVDMIEFRKDKI